MFYLGVDLGQRRDHTALAIVERLDLVRRHSAPVFQGLSVRHLERVSLGTPYPAVVARVRALVASDEMGGKCSVAVDATGLGAPVVDLLRAAGMGCELAAVTITGGDREHHQMGNNWNVPKRDLMAGLQVLLERGELKIARGLRDMGAMVRELMDVRMTASGALGSGASARVRLGADGCGEHDDLVIALSLACWMAKKPRNGYGMRRLV